MQDYLFGLLLFCLLGGIVAVIAKKHFFEWQRQKKYTAIINQIDKLYHDVNPFQISLQARAQNPGLPEGLTYGEISVCALLDLLKEIPFNHNDVFYDLGSGIGKTLLAVKLCYPTLDVRGIEILPELHQVALTRYQDYLQIKQKIAGDFAITHLLDNFLAYNFSDANIIFINATGYTNVELEALLPKLINLKQGTKIIVTSKTLPETVFEKKYQGMEKMSWGLTSTYIYEKIR